MAGGYIFGGFTSKPWKSSFDHVTDPNAYIFSMVNHENKPFKAMCSNDGQYAMFCDSEFGPCFGGDDIEICSDSNIINDSKSKLCAYKRPSHEADTEKAKFIIAGSKHFLSSAAKKTKKSWTSDDESVTDPNAYTLSLVNKEECLSKLTAQIMIKMQFIVVQEWVLVLELMI